jgi:plasmid stabilization system protein ParE
MRELFWTPEARQDRNEIYDYIEADNPAAALTLDELFSKNAGHLLGHPGLGRAGRVNGTRELVVHPNHILMEQAPATHRARWRACVTLPNGLLRLFNVPNIKAAFRDLASSADQALKMLTPVAVSHQMATFM